MDSHAALTQIRVHTAQNAPHWRAIRCRERRERHLDRRPPPSPLASLGQSAEQGAREQDDTSYQPDEFRSHEYASLESLEPALS